MTSKDLVKLGSATAKGGFKNERTIIRKFNNWKKDKDTQLWLKIMGYNLKKIEKLKSIQVHRQKADVQVRILIKIGNAWKIENISVKLAKEKADFNQVDKRPVDKYQKMWGFNNRIARGLKLFTGEIKPKFKTADPRRAKFIELPERTQKEIIDFFRKNKILVVTDILKGREGITADWMMVARYRKKKNETEWILKDINTAMNFFGKGRVKISSRGSRLFIGKIGMQRKGGTPDPTSLQFKISPCQLFELTQHTP